MRLNYNRFAPLCAVLAVVIACLGIERDAHADEVEDPEQERAACLARVWAPGTIRLHDYSPDHLQCYGDGAKWETYFWEVFARWAMCLENRGDTVGVVDITTQSGRYAEIVEVPPRTTRCVSPRWGHGKIYVVNLGRTHVWAGLKDLSTRAEVYRVPLDTADILP